MGETPERVRALGREPWITALEIPNSGWPSRPRNTGLAAARGDYVFFMDHDDLLYPRAVERMLAAADANSADMVVGKEVRTGARTMGLESFRAERVACARGRRPRHRHPDAAQDVSDAVPARQRREVR